MHTLPISFSIDSFDTPPDLSITGIRRVISITVDSIPILVLPPSKISLIFPARSSFT